jgi:membrane protein DedA with SNARE-associated domain
LEQVLTDILMQTDGIAAYALIFGVLVACGLGLPLPEDISLVTGGFLAYLEAANLPAMMVVGFVGILCGDSLIFLAGRRVGTQVGRGKGFFSRVVTPEKRRRVEDLFACHGEKIVMVARFLPGVRAVTYFTAGSARMKYLRFILWDGVAALVSAPLLVYLGYRFGDELERLIQAVRRGESAAIIGVLLVVLALFVIRRMRAAAQRNAQREPCVKALEMSNGSPSADVVVRSSAGSPQDSETVADERLETRAPLTRSQ